MSRFAQCFAIAGFTLALVAAAQERPALGGMDPVELCEGRRTPGDDARVAAHGRYTYRFASADNKKRFEADPERFAIRYSGACARMGPLSGAGNPDRWSVHDGRIYIFASDACRKSFEKAPERHLDRPDEDPPETSGKAVIGAERLKKLIAGLGGEKAVDGAASWELIVKQPYKTREGEAIAVIVRTWGASGRHRHDETYGDWKSALALDGKAGISVVGKKEVALEPEECAYLARRALRHPLALAQARGLPGFHALGSGEEKVGDVKIEKLLIWVAGALAKIGLDPDGRAVSMEYEGRLGGPIGKIIRRYSDFRKVGDLTLPYKVETEFDGKPEAAPTVYDSIRINPPLAEGFWKGK